jgi:hypothetical protein
MNLLELAKEVGVSTDTFVRLYQYKCVAIEASPSFPRGVAVTIDSRKIPRDDEEARLVAHGIKNLSVLEHLELYYQMVLWGEGPKIFRPSAEQLFALEQMNLNVEISDFHLPFRMIAVELPEAYRVTKKDDTGAIPYVSLMFREPSINFFGHDLLYSRTAIKAYWRGLPDEHLEEWLALDYSAKKQVGRLETSLEEYTVEGQVRRAILNYCLLLDEVGYKDNGPQQPNEYAKLVKWCAKNNQHTQKNKRHLQAHPRIYGLSKAPTPLVRYVGSSNELPGEQPGWKVKPHCRRGHYRMQPTKTGPKRIRIAPVFVNAYLMLAPTGGTYQT